MPAHEPTVLRPQLRSRRAIGWLSGLWSALFVLLAASGRTKDLSSPGQALSFIAIVGWPIAYATGFARQASIRRDGLSICVTPPLLRPKCVPLSVISKIVIWPGSVVTVLDMNDRRLLRLAEPPWHLAEVVSLCAELGLPSDTRQRRRK